MARTCTRTPVLSSEQEAEAQRLAERLHTASKDDYLQLARLLVSKPDAQLFGATEFELRDRSHDLVAKALQHTLGTREKKTTTRVRA